MATAKVNQYKVDVLNVNKALKAEVRSLNLAAKLLIAAESVPSKYKKVLRAILKDKELYKQATNIITKGGKRKVAPFYVLQFLYKVEKTAQAKKVKFEAKQVTLLKVA